MILLADENVQRTVVDSLRQKGHAVQHVQEMTPGVPDETVLEMATRESAILLTYDRDFGELVFHQKQIAKGVILVRFPGLPPERVAELVSAAISAHGEEIKGAFTVNRRGPRHRLQSRAQRGGALHLLHEQGDRAEHPKAHQEAGGG